MKAYLSSDGYDDLGFALREADPKTIIRRPPSDDGVWNCNLRVPMVLWAPNGGYCQLG